MKKIETKRLLLRHIIESDAEDIFRYSNEPDVGPAAGWRPHKNITETLSIMRELFIGQKNILGIVLKNDKGDYNISPIEDDGIYIGGVLHASQAKSCTGHDILSGEIGDDEKLRKEQEAENSANDFNNLKGRMIGTIGLTSDPRRHNPGAMMMGYALSHNAWGRGIMTEAARAVVKHAFSEIRKLDVISCTCYPDNIGSRRVIEKCGFNYEGRMQHDMTV